MATKPEIEFIDGPAPDVLVITEIIVGDGVEATAGARVDVHYVGVDHETGEQFDSSWDRGTPIDFGIGTSQVITGWDEGLVGQTVGSQVLLIVPPDKGYGTAGNPNIKVTGTDTLVFVVDILGLG